MIAPFDVREHRGVAGSHSVLPMLFLHRTLADVQRFYRDRTLARSIAQAKVGEARAKQFAHVAPEQIEFDAILQHETDHLRRNLGTTSGLLQFRLLRENASILQHGIRQQIGLGTLRFPLVSQARPPLTDLPHRLENAEPICELWNASEHPRVSLLARARLELATWLEGDGRMMNPWAEFGIIDFFSGRCASDLPKVEVVPTIHPSETPTNSVGVGARDVFEFFALMREADWHGHYGAQPESAVRRIRETNSEYSRVFGLLGGNFASAFRMTAQAARPGDWITDVTALWPAEVYALVDLALWPPFGPRGSVRCPRRTIDVHPGLRLLQSIHVLRQREQVWTPIGSAERYEAFDRTQANICEAMAWPRPEELVREWRSYIESKNAEFVEDFGPCAPMVKASFDLRHASPLDAVIGNIDPAKADVLRFPCWSFFEPDGVTIHAVHGSETDASSFVRQYFVLRGSLSLLHEQDAFVLTLNREHVASLLATISSDLSWDKAEEQAIATACGKYLASLRGSGVD